MKKQNLMLALTFLAQRNVSKCSHKARADAVLALSSLDLLLDDIKKTGIGLDDKYKNKEIKAFYEIIGGTSPAMAYMRADYKALAEDIRSKIEAIKELESGSFNPFELTDEITELLAH